MNNSLLHSIKLLLLIFSLLFCRYQVKAEHRSHRINTGNVASPMGNVAVDKAAPVVSWVNVPAAREYKTGDILTFDVIFSTIIITNPIGVTPYLPVKIGSKQLMIPMYAGVGLTNIVFQYTIQPGDQDLDGIEVGAALTMSSGTIQDQSGNDAVLTLNNVADTRGVLINSSYPTVDLSGPSSSTVNGTFSVLIVFSDFVSGLTASDFTLVNATITEPQTTDSVNYFIDVTPVTDGPLSVFLPANAAVNKGPNGNQASNQIDLTADLTAPTITQLDVPAAGKYGTTSSLNFIVHFSEPVIMNTNNGTPVLSLTIGGKTVMADLSLWIDNNTFAFSYWIQDGDMDMDGIAIDANLLLNGARIRDAARNNANLALPAGTDVSGITVNTVRPTAVLSTTIDSLVNNPFTISLVFSEPVTGLTESSFQTTNLYFDEITTTDNIHYTLSVGANHNGPVKISLLQDGGVNAYSSGNTASNEITLMGDFTSPKITRLGLPANSTYNINSTMDFTVEYNEVVYVKTTGGTPYIPITVGTKVVRALYLSGSGTNTLVYRYTVAEGEKDLDGVTLARDIRWGGGRIQDLVGNDALTLLPANNTPSLIVNAIRPTVVLSTTAPSVLKNSFLITIVFSEAVSGLTAFDFTSTNADVTTPQTADGITYTIWATPRGGGPVSVSLPADAAVSNSALNGNVASNQISVTADFTPPVITQIDLPAKGYYHTGDKLTFVAHFSEDVAINVTNGYYNLPIYINTWWAPAFYSGVFTANTMTFTYTILNGDKADSIVFRSRLGTAGNESIRDSSGNDADISIPANIDGSGIFINAVQPGVVLSTAAANVVSQPFTATAVFTELVTGLTETDFVVNNATVSNVQTTDGITYTLLVSPISDGQVSVSLPVDVAGNTAGHGNTASNTLTVDADMTAPVVTLVGVPADGYYNASGTLSFTVSYGEDVLVNTTNGSPTLPVNIGGTVVQAQYTNGSGSSQLVFDYAVQPGDADMDGIAVGTDLLLNGATMKDAAGNNAGLTLNNIGVTTQVFVNTTHPTVTLSTTAPTVLNNPFIVTAVFSEEVTGFTFAGFNLVNANAGAPQTTDRITYTIEITPMTNGPVSVAVAADAALNVGLNGNTVSNQITVTADFRQPKITQVDIPAIGYYNATQALTFTVHFDETVAVDTTAGVPLMAVTMDAATVPVEYVSGSGTKALLFRYAIQEGDIDVDGIFIGPAISLGTGATIGDTAGNDANLIFPAALDGSGILVNTAHPAVVLSTTAGATVTAQFVVTATFTEAVTGLAETDFTVTNATISNLQTTDRITYTFSVTPAADGTISISLPANTTVNIGNNGNTASNALSITADITAPVITQVDVPADGYYKEGSALTFVLRYSEPVVVNTTLGIPAIGINIGGTTVPAIYTSGSGTSLLTFSYTVRNGDIDMDGILLNNGMVMNGGTIKDAAGNIAPPLLNNIAPTTHVFVNTAHPTVTLSTAAATTVNAPFTVTVVFSEVVNGLSAGDFSLTNASAGLLQTTDYITYALSITPTADGAVGISLPADAAVNVAGNGNTASNTITVTADVTAPVITEVSVPTSGYYKAGSTLNFVVKYSENVIVSGGTPAIGVNIGGTTVSAVYTSGTGTQLLSFSYTVQNGDLDMDGITLGASLLLNSATIRDAVNNNATLTLNNIGNTSNVFVNTVHPTVTLSTAASTVNAPFTVTAVFSEVVNGLLAGDFSLSNASAGVLTTTDHITYTIEITPTADGTVGISLPADAAVNVGGNGNTASNTITVTADVTAPVVTEVSVPTSGYYKAGSILNFVVKYSEQVIVNGGTPSLSVNIGGTTVSAVYTGGTGTQLLSFSYMVQNGDLDMDGITLGASLLLNSATIRDAVNNNATLTLNNIGNTSNVFVNTVHPTVTLSTAASTVNAPFTVTAVFSEVVNGLLAGDFSLSNASAGVLTTIDHITYTIEITPTADGAVSISLPADAAVNVGGNGNTASNTITVTADVTAPVVTQVSVPTSGYYKAGSILNFVVKYSEQVIVNGGTPAISVNIGGTTVSAVYTGGTGTQLLSFSYTVQNGDLDMDGITLGASLLLNSATIRDAVNNNAALTLNNVGNTSGVFVNTVHPTVILSTAATTVNAPFTVTAVFSDVVNGLLAGDFSLTNASAGVLTTIDHITYTIEITPTADGAVSISLPADAAVNIAGNGNTGSNALTVIVDLTAPVIRAGQTFSVNEHSPVGTAVGTLSATETRGTLQHWTITTDGSGGAFGIDATTGTITVKNKTILDSKVNTTVTLMVTVSDGLNTSAAEAISISVVQVALPPTDINIDNNTINERSPVSTLVGTLSAVSAAPAATFTYSLVTGAGSTDNSAFQIIGNQLQTAAVLSFGTKNIRVKATDNNGLSIEKALTIQVNQVNQAPVMDVIGDQQVCNTGAVQTLQLTGVSPVEAGQTLSYTIAADQPYFNTLTVSGNGLISYSIKTGVTGSVNVTVTVKDNGGTANGGVDFLQRTFKVTVSSLPVVTITADKGTTIAKGTVIQLTASGGDTYSWANADGIISGQQEAVLKVKQVATTTYQVTATNANGCSNTGTITITVAEGIKVDAGNILTPNGDGKNDRWIVNNLALYPDNEVTIYDRAGRVVYRRKNYSNDWDGTVNGNPLAEGTYYYVLVIKDNNTIVKGFITILRDK